MSKDEISPPKLVKRREHKKSGFQAGRTIGEKRERLETANERAAARKKDKNKKTARIAITLIGFLFLAGIIIALLNFFTNNNREVVVEEEITKYEPTIEIIDEDASSGGQITARMREFIGQIESSFKEYKIQAKKAIIPSGKIREVRFYIEGYNGYIKTVIDRSAGATAEDVSRMLAYLKDSGVNDFEYLDVRIEGKAYWK